MTPTKQARRKVHKITKFCWYTGNPSVLVQTACGTRFPAYGPNENRWHRQWGIVTCRRCIAKRPRKGK